MPARAASPVTSMHGQSVRRLAVRHPCRRGAIPSRRKPVTPATDVDAVVDSSATPVMSPRGSMARSPSAARHGSAGPRCGCPRPCRLPRASSTACTAGAFGRQVTADHPGTLERRGGVHVPILETVLAEAGALRPPALAGDRRERLQVLLTRPASRRLHQDRLGPLAQPGGEAREPAGAGRYRCTVSSSGLVLRSFG